MQTPVEMKPLLLGCFLIVHTIAISGATIAQEVALPAENSQNGEKGMVEKLEALCDERNLPALWVGRFQANGNEQIAVAGVRKWQSDEKAAVDDVIHLGSCTKAMTAAIIGQLCSEGKLQLDTEIKAIFTDIPQLTTSDWGTVRVEQLMQHRSGAPANLDYHRLDQQHADDVQAARRALLETLCNKRRPRRERFEYSNVGYIVLGHIAERIENKPWEVIAEERIFRPLGITTAYFGPVGKPDQAGQKPYTDDNALPGRAWGHSESASLGTLAKALFGGKAKPDLVPQQIDNSRCLGPAGRAHMSMRDWSKFVMLFAQKDGYKRLGISEIVWQSMLTPVAGASDGEKYAAGWVVIDKPEYQGRCYFHNGSNTTWYCYALALPGKDECILVATNVYSNEALRTCDELARAINKQGWISNE